MRHPLRIYGQVQDLDPAKLEKLHSRALSPFQLFENQLEIDYLGPYLDLEPLLQEIADALGPDGRGEVDYLDYADWELIRYKLKPGSWSYKRIDPDLALEKYHQE
ncbi:MAG: hypothetical protein R6U22_05105 [Desulfohalobiaceae bacterium]